MKAFLRHLRMLAPLLVLFLYVDAKADTLSESGFIVTGQIFFADGFDNSDSTFVPASYVTVYESCSGVGVVSDVSGRFSLFLPGVRQGDRIVVELSHIGYSSLFEEMSVSGESADAGILVMKPLAIVLPSAYVMPGFENPADYILEMVRKKAKAAKKAVDYEADVRYGIETHEMPLVAKALSGLSLAAVRTAAALAGIGHVVNYALDNDDLEAEVSLVRSVTGGKVRDHSARIVSATPGLPRKVSEELLDGFRILDLYEFLYSDNCLWGRNHRKKCRFSIMGTYLWRDKYVDILEWRYKNGKIFATVHVVQDDWSILKVEAGYGDRVVRCEARDRGDGLYMPVSFVVKPSFFPVIKAEDIPRRINEVKSDTRLKKGTKKRLVKVLEANRGRDIHPYVTGSFAVSYRLQ